jgi:magnesium chelatase family protein
MLVAAMNPCPCGYFGSKTRSCRCSTTQIDRYLAKISGPLIDRIDIHIDIGPVSFQKLRSKKAQLDSATVRAEVLNARAIQHERFGDGKLMTNAMMSHKQVEKLCPLDSASEEMLKHAMNEFGLSARAHDKIIKLARTIADLDNSEKITPAYIAEAISYRKLDRKM